jgi:hypothetical protein
MPTQDIEESPGVVSMMRKGVKIALGTGRLLIIGAIALSGAMLARDRYELVPVAVAMISGGPALMLGALGAKAWQAQAENR